jgi:hypothetical protein
MGQRRTSMSTAILWALSIAVNVPIVRVEWPIV